MKNKLLTITIPMYNMEKYIGRCLDSLIIEDPKLFNLLEIIVVNDGSKDSSLNIAKKYASKYPDSIVVIDKTNGNYGSCVNVGLEKATGLYFRLLDADDFFNTKSLVTLIQYIRDNNDLPDMIVTNYQRDFADNGTQYILANKMVYNKRYSINDFNFSKLNKGMMCVMHSMTYNTNILKKCNLRHLEGISYTDTEYCFYPLEKVESVVFLNIILYCYQLGRDGQTVSDESYKKNIHHLYIIIERALHYIENKNINYKGYENQLHIIYLAIFIYYRILLTCKFEHNEDITKLDNYIAHYHKDLYNKMYSITKLGVPIMLIWRILKTKCNGTISNFTFRILSKIKRGIW